MPLWNDIRTHLRSEATKYLVGAAGLGLVALMWNSWDFVKRESKIVVINFLKEVVAEDPEHNQDGSKRDPNTTHALTEFHDGLEKQVKKINSTFVGYVQTGTVNIPYGDRSIDEQKNIRRKGRDTQHFFQIFAGKKSHVYLEFDIGPFSVDNYSIQLTFFEEPVCPKHVWTEGFNVIEFEVTDIQSRDWEFVGECAESRQRSSQVPRVKSTQGHKAQLIPVGIKIISNKVEKETRLASLDEAIRSGQPIDPLRSRSLDKTSLSDSKTSPAGEMVIGYIVVVSPLVEDVFFARSPGGVK